MALIQPLSELKIIAKHAGTVLVGQLAVMAYSVTDTIVAGRYSSGSLAALSVGAAIYISVFVALLGVTQAMLPIWAELHGAKKESAIGQSFRQSLYLCAVTSAIGMLILFNPAPIFRWTQVPEALRQEALDYLWVLAWTLPPSLLFRLVSTLNQSLGRPLLVTWLQIGSLVLKVPLSIWFAFGGLGLAPRGAVGCALASLVVGYGLLVVALWMLRTQPMYQPLRVWQRLEAPNWRQIGGYARLGVPSALAVMVEVTSFTLMALFIARLGTTAAGSHQIAMNLAALLYMLPLAISIAASARVSFWLGSGDAARARHAIKLGLASVFGLGLLMSGVLLAVRHLLVPIYSSSSEIAALAVPMLAWVALYHVFDGLQSVGLFVLRCFRVAFVPFVIYAVLLWGGGLGGGYLLAYQGLGPWAAMQSPIAFWIMSSLALGATALSLLLLLRMAATDQH